MTAPFLNRPFSALAKLHAFESNKILWFWIWDIWQLRYAISSRCVSCHKNIIEGCRPAGSVCQDLVVDAKDLLGRGKDWGCIETRGFLWFLCFSWLMNECSFLNPRRNCYCWDPYAESCVVEPIFNSQPTIWIRHPILRRTDMIIEASVLIISNNKQCFIP